MKKHILSAVIAAVCAATLQAQTTIVNYSTGGTNVPGYTGFFNSADGWNNVGDPLWQGQKGWTGTSSGADSVSVIAGTTPSGANDASGTLGVFLPALPLNTTSVTLDRGFTPMSTMFFTNIAVSFVAEWNIIDFSAPTPYNDKFTFDLRNTANTQSLLSFSMQGPAVNPGFDYTLASTGTSTINQLDASYGALVRMQVDLVGTGYSGTLWTVNPTTRALTLIGSLNGGTLNNGLTASDFGSLQVGWDLASGDPNQPGTLGLVVNELTIQSTGDPIPEPGTWAMAAFLVSGAAATIYRRRKAAKETLDA